MSAEPQRASAARSWAYRFLAVVAIALVGTATVVYRLVVAYVIAGVSVVAAVLNERLNRHHQARSRLARHVERREGDHGRDDRGGDGDRG